MRGTQFLAALLKVNPFFTIALAVGFTGVAGVGLNHVDGVSLKKLIPLQIKSLFSENPTIPAGTEIPDFELAQHTIQELLAFAARTGAPDNEVKSYAPLLVPPHLSSTQLAFRPARALAGPPAFWPADTGADEPASKTDQTMAGGPRSTHSSPPVANPPSSPETPALQDASTAAPFPQLPSRLSGAQPQMALKPDKADVPPDAALVPPATLLFALAAPPSSTFPTGGLPSFPPGITVPGYPLVPLPPYEPVRSPPGSGVVATPEPPMQLVFAGLLAVMVGLRHRATRNRATRNRATRQTNG
jgi:hypothetical protein